MSSKVLVVACGGTGGHVFPGLAVARELKRRGHAVRVWFAGRDIERAALAGWKDPVYQTGVRQLAIRTIPHLARAFFRCRSALRQEPADALLAMGSYTSLPPLLAARLRRTPIVLHEANAVPGKAVDGLSRFAVVTATSFEETSRWLPGRSTVLTGLPVREDLADRPPFDNIPPGAFTTLVTGGSQGARRVNELASRAMVLLRQTGERDFFVIHQTGAADEAAVRARYEAAGVPAMVSAFIQDMGRAYASADLVIARAGASTCFELCRVRKPSLLIPLPTAVRNHQHLNAAVLVRSGGADEAFQHELTARSLMRYILHKKNHPSQLLQMRQALAALTIPDAATRVANLLEQVAAG